MYLTVCLNPTLQRTVVLSHLWEGEVNRTNDHRIDASGKGVNVARVLAQLGQDVVHLTQCGGRDGEKFLNLARADGLAVRAVPSDQEVRTATTLLNREKGTTTEILEEGRPVTEETEDLVREAYLQLLAESHTVIISGSKAPGFSGRLFPWMVAEARSRDLTVVIDYRGEDLKASLVHGPTVIKPNLAEFIQTFFPGKTVVEGRSQQNLVRLAGDKIAELHAEYGIMIVLTRGRYETIYSADGAINTMAPIDGPIINTIGSGDAFAAGLAFALREGEPLAAAVRQGHQCAIDNAARLRPGVVV